MAFFLHSEFKSVAVGIVLENTTEIRKKHLVAVVGEKASGHGLGVCGKMVAA